MAGDMTEYNRKLVIGQKTIVRGSAKGGLLALVPTRTARREELTFSFVYDGVAAGEFSVDPVWTPMS